MAIANRDAAQYIAALQPFEGSNLRGQLMKAFTGKDGTYYPSEYRVFSYSTLMATVKGGQVIFRNDRYYSQTTSRHQTRIRQGLASLSEDATIEVWSR